MAIIIQEPEEIASEQSPLLPLPPSSPSACTTEVNRALSTASEHEDQPRISALRGTILALSVAVLVCLQASNFSLMTTIQSPIAADLDAFQYASWFTSTYIIASASITPLAGRLYPLLSPRLYILTSCLLTATGALITSLAPHLPLFLLGRALHGIGGATITPVSLILIIDLTSVSRRGLYLGCVNTCYTIGIGCGAIFGGALAPVVGWRGIFALQAPVAVGMGVVVFLALPVSAFSEGGHGDGRKDAESWLDRLGGIDFLGALLLVCTLVLFLYGLATPEITYSTMVASMGTLVAFLVVEASPRTPHPILPLAILRSRAVLLTCLSALFAMVARWSVLLYTPVYALSVRSFPPAEAGLILLPTNAGFALGNILLGYFHVRRTGSFYTSCLVVGVLFTVSVLILSRITTTEASMVAYCFVTGWNGFMIGAGMVYNLTHVLHRTPKESHFIVSSLVATFRGLSASFGSAIGGGMFERVLRRALTKGFEEEGIPVDAKTELIRRLLGSPALVSRLEGVERQVAVDGYVVAFRTLFEAAAVLAAVATLVQAGTGWESGQDDGGDVGAAGGLQGDEGGGEGEGRRR